MTQHHSPSDERELEELAAQYSERRTYRPSDDVAEPDDVPQAPSGTAMGEAPASD